MLEFLCVVIALIIANESLTVYDTGLSGCLGELKVMSLFMKAKEYVNESVNADE